MPDKCGLLDRFFCIVEHKEKDAFLERMLSHRLQSSERVSFPYFPPDSLKYYHGIRDCKFEMSGKQRPQIGKNDEYNPDSMIFIACLI